MNCVSARHNIIHPLGCLLTRPSFTWETHRLLIHRNTIESVFGSRRKHVYCDADCIFVLFLFYFAWCEFSIIDSPSLSVVDIWCLGPRKLPAIVTTAKWPEWLEVFKLISNSHKVPRYYLIYLWQFLIYLYTGYSGRVSFDLRVAFDVYYLYYFITLSSLVKIKFSSSVFFCLPVVAISELNPSLIGYRLITNLQ